VSTPRASSQRAFESRLKRVYALYTLGFALFVVVLAVLEQMGLPRSTIGYVFLASTILLYAAIGIVSRTNDADEYYVAGRRVPAMFNGMAIAADWMSAASFIGLAGGLYLQGYAGLAYVMGWTGGFVLLALLLAPYLRKFGRYTIPDFLGARYGGHVPRVVGLAIAILVSFTYVVAQIYGVGLITTRLTGVDFTIGIFLGLAGILVCSFLGGMKAVTWTQVAQYVVLIVAYLIPVVWLSVTQTGLPLPQVAYGAQLEKVTALEQQLIDDPAEKEVRQIFRDRAAAAAEALADPSATHLRERARLEMEVMLAKVQGGPSERLRLAEEALARHPKDEAAARAQWSRDLANAPRANPPLRHGEAFPGKDEESRDVARANFLALVFCLMLGTAALPHLLTRFYTTPTVREARHSVTWSLFFIVLLYLSAPALAVLVKYVMYHDVVGTAFGSLPGWVQSWSRVDPSLLSITDVNRDGIVQLAEISIGSDIVVLAMPEIAGLPSVISGLVAAGGLAAALSTADGLLLTIASALSHDFYYKIVDPDAPTARRVLLSKVVLLGVAVLAALVAALKPGDILFLVSAAFSLAAAGLFPALVLGIFWKRATGLGATLGMLAGFAVTFWYMARNQPWLREAFFGIPRSAPVDALWWEIQPIAAGVFGVPIGVAVIVLVSLATPVPAASTRAMVDRIRHPRLPAE
jgi:cation/acetate symporter